MHGQRSLSDRVIGAIADYFLLDHKDVRPEMSAIDVPGWDSVSQVGLALQLEDEFGITLEPGMLNNASDIRALIDLVGALTKGQTK